ncbi:hypothetical protein FNU76_17690 [Chitinimonas arctica]|uniref:Guanylate cyclase domain-containing protein n=1 Tax=Chitinimonas arctica TaxID=2594795 RepID=A0A516SIP4_9NEIS|nr:adenylate/guanylate cyclase domain-containing protein [Chitinimonas arctica]QDQ28029.1 hypothetical protein FNU76_17690 [Chitinimonas arctica]
MFERINKTLICSVVFLDIVEYSRQPVTTQMLLKEAFNGLLSTALHDIAVNDRIIIDTGDGAAICFLGDPEDALFVAISLRDAVHQPSQTEQTPFEVRIGINLGPAKLVKDINGRPNLLGDGINAAERIMSFAAPGYILVSRSYYEVVSRLSEEYAQLLQYHGSHTDKHVREHEVYQVGFGELARRVTQPDMPRRASPGSPSHNRHALNRRQLRVAGLAGALLLVGGWWLLPVEEPILTFPPLKQATPPSPAPMSTAAPIIASSNVETGPAGGISALPAPVPAPLPSEITASKPDPAPVRHTASARQTTPTPIATPTEAATPRPSQVVARVPSSSTSSSKTERHPVRAATPAPTEQVRPPAAPCPQFECWPNGRPKRDR